MNRRNIRSLKRQKENKRVRLIVFFAFLAVIAGLGIVIFARYYVPLKEIVFIGNSHLKNEELRALIQVRENEALFRVSAKKIHESLKQSPWIKDAVIRKELSGRMLIKVTEGIPVAILKLSGISYLIDRDGFILEQMKDGTVQLLPVIKDIEPGNSREAYSEAVRFVRILRDKRVLAYEGNLEITAQRPEDMTLKVDNVSIKIGTGDFEKKLERLKSVRDEIEKRNITIDYIDLRFANKIVVKPAGGAEGDRNNLSVNALPAEIQNSRVR